MPSAELCIWSLLCSPGGLAPPRPPLSCSLGEAWLIGWLLARGPAAAFCAIVGSFCGFACAYILFCAAAMLATASETPRSVVFFPRPFAPFRAPHFLQYYSVLALVLLRAVSSGPSCRILAGLDRTSVVSGSPSCPAKGEELGTTA